VRIRSYPIIIFEFSEGFYTTKDLYINNTFNHELDPFGSSMAKFKKTFGTSFKREVKFSTYNEKFKQWDFFQRQTQILVLDKSEKLKELNNELNSNLEIYQKYFYKYEMISNISEYRKKIFHLGDKIDHLSNYIDGVKKIISQKKNDLRISLSIFNFNKENLTEKLIEGDKNR
jgi:hypothetical protein